MSLGPEEIIRNDEGSLEAPVNVISDDSLDCGCKQLPCPRLAKYATRPAFVSVLSVIGILQGATQAYLLITSPTVSRRFGIDYNSMDWVLGTFYITQCVGGLALAYWGDRIHRASWTGALVLLQSVCFLTFIIPQFTHPNKAIEEPTESNVTHSSIYAEDSPEICAAEGSARIINGENDECYFVLFLFAVAQIISGFVSVAYYALGLSYLDDNTKKKNVSAYMGWIVSMNLMGLLFGSLLAWSFLKIDADNFNPVESYREQIGAWWLGWPILAILLAIPALLLAIFPRRLVSEVIEQAAGKILNDSGNSGRSYNVSQNKVGSTSFLSSSLRLLNNKILMLNVGSATFCAMALYNFLMNENLFLESRFYAPRPNNILLGFNDPITSRAVTATLKPLLVGLTVIISGFVIAKIKPRAMILARYHAGVILLASIIIFGLAFDNCDKKPIVGNKYGSLSLIKFCNYDCRCTKDADFRPVCDVNGMNTFYSACYAACRSINVTDGIRSYDGCGCIGTLAGGGNFKAVDGSCDFDKCQSGWIIFEVATLFVYALASSTIVGDLLINLRSSYVQDKALVIAFTMMWVAFSIQIPGKLIYKSFADSTCQHWGLDERTCRFHTDSYGYYLCLVTFAFLLVGAILKGVASLLCNNLNLFEVIDTDEQQGEELREVTQFQSQPLLNQQSGTPNDEANNTTADVEQNPEPSVSQEPPEEPKVKKVNHVQSACPPEKTEPGRTVTFATTLRPNSIYASVSKSKSAMNIVDSSSDESSNVGKSPDSKIGYKPLELDSDTETDLYNYGPRSRKRLPSKTDDNEPVEVYRPFPNPDNYEDPRQARGYVKMTTEVPSKDGLNAEMSRSQGDFNEIGIPIVEIESDRMKKSFDKSHDSIVMCQYDRTTNRMESSRFMRSLDEMRVPPDIEKTLHMLTDNLRRPPSRDQESSGFGSLQNVSDSPVRRSLRRSGSKESSNSKTSASTSESHSKTSPIVTDL